MLTIYVYVRYFQISFNLRVYFISMYDKIYYNKKNKKNKIK